MTTPARPVSSGPQSLSPITDSIYRVACALLERFSGLSRGVRLTGVSASDLAPLAPPMTLFPDEDKLRREKLEAVTQGLKQRFGRDALARARLIKASED